MFLQCFHRSSYPDYKEKPTGKDEDEEDVDIEQLVVDGYELVLPSGEFLFAHTKLFLS